MKSARQEKILDLILTRDIETQDELCDLLNELGFSVTQATVSRDIRELRLFKVEGPGGRLKYASQVKTTEELSTRYINIFKEGFVMAETAQNILVIKTAPGLAMAVGAALDGMNLREIVGVIAGDDTIMCAIRTNEEAAALKDKLMSLARE